MQALMGGNIQVWWMNIETEDETSTDATARKGADARGRPWSEWSERAPKASWCKAKQTRFQRMFAFQDAAKRKAVARGGGWRLAISARRGVTYATAF